MAEYFTIRTDTGLQSTFTYTDWDTYLRFNEGNDLGGHRVAFVTTLYDAKHLEHAIRKGNKIIEWYRDNWNLAERKINI